MAEIYNYKAKEMSGAVRRGKIEAMSEKEVAAILKKNNLIPININKQETITDFSAMFAKFSGVSGREIAVFTRMLATMLTSGLTLTASLSNLSEQIKNSKLKNAILDIIKRVAGGSSFSEALQFHKDVFDALFINLVRAGETSGKLEETLFKLAETLETREEFAGKVKGALVYPAIVVGMMIIIAIVMMVMVIPKITKVYIEFGATLPLPTLIVVLFPI